MKLETFQDRCVQALKARNAHAVSKILGVSPNTVWLWGQGSLPRKDTLIRISRISNVSIHWLITGEGEKFLPTTGLMQDADPRETFLDRCMAAMGVSNASALAKRLGVTPAAVRMWARDSLPRKETLLEISRISGKSLHWLITGQSDSYVKKTPSAPPPENAAPHDGNIRDIVRDELRAAVREELTPTIERVVEQAIYHAVDQAVDQVIDHFLERLLEGHWEPKKKRR